VQQTLLLLDTVAPGVPVEDSIRVRALTDRLLSHSELAGSGPLTAIRLATLADTGTAPTIIARLVEGPDVWRAGLARMFRAHSAENEGDLDQVRIDVTAALDCFTRAGDRWGLAKALPLRALLRQYDGDLDGALTDLNEATRLAREFGTLSLSDEIYIALRSIDLHVRLDDTAQATELIAAARERALRSTSLEPAILLDAREADLRMRIGDLVRARELVESAEAGLYRSGPPAGPAWLRSAAAAGPDAAGPSAQPLFGGGHAQALVGAARGALCLELGDGPGAEDALGRAYAAAVDSKDLPIVATVAVTVAGLAELYGRHRDVAVLLGAAARLRGAHDQTDPRVRTLSNHGRAALGDEQFAEAYETGRQLTAPAALARAYPARLRPAALPAADGAAPPGLGGARE
jgi:tetratricopeptide (TPR) repeat protein